MLTTPPPRRTPLALALACTLAAALGLSAGACRGGARPGAQPPDAAAPSAPRPPAEPAFGPAAIDAAVRAAWQERGITPTGLVDDAGFLRRAWLDIAGTLPPPEAVTAFLADGSPDKRAKAIDALLAGPHYASRQTDAWDEILMGGPVRAPAVDRGAFRRWLHAHFEANTPWDRLVHALLTATGKNSAGGPRRGPDGPAADPAEEKEAGVNGAVNWLLKYARSPLDLPAAASRVFLGVQIQCAQCHDHKTEKWTQADFRSFAACFSQVRAQPAGGAGKGEQRIVEVVDGERPRRVGRKNPDREELMAVAEAPPRALDGADLSDSDNRRQALAAWIVSPRNPWFARAIVNRVWASLIGRGFVEPVDDLRPGNPGVLPDLQQRLADDFVAHGHDMKHLIRTIARTELYQRAAAPLARPADDALWPRYRVRPLPPGVLLGALIAATGLDPVIERVAGERRAALEAQLRLGFGFLFDVDEDAATQDSYDGTIPQALFLLNGAIGAAGASAAIPGTAVAEALALPGDDAARIEALYLRALSRRPTPAEIERWTRFLAEPRDAVRTEPPPRAERARGRGGRLPGRVDLPPALSRRLYARPGTAREQAFEDLFWALLNSSEFFFNH